MSQSINISDSLAISPSGYTGQTNIASENTTYPWSRGYNNVDYTTNYARFQLNTSDTTTNCYIYYTFSVSGIPSGATISSVSCSARISRNSRVGNSTVQLYNGTTAKSSSVTFSSTSTTGSSVTPTSISSSNAGTWTLSELGNIRLRITGRRSNTNNTGYIYFWGATLTINYTLQGTAYEVISTLSTDAVDSIDPAGLTLVNSGENYTLSIYADSLDNVKVEDNGNNVTSSLVQNQISNSGSESTVLGTYTLVSNSFNGSGGTYFSGRVGKGVDSTTTTSNYYSSGSGVITEFKYALQFSSIPSNATITRLYCQVNGHAESTSNNNEYMCVRLKSGNTNLSEETNFKSVGTSNTTITLEATTIPTLAQLENLVLYCRLGYYGGAINGATCYVEYTLPSSGNSYYWTYTLTNVSADHAVVVGDAIIEIPEEDPQYDYYSLTISSINATTSPGRGTTRIVEGSNQTITIYPTDPLVTLVTDNGTNISSQLVSHSTTIPTPTVTTVSGASYGFNLNSSTGYYVSANTGVASSAAVSRVDFNLPVSCLVTIQYINYAEEGYDFGVFGNIDVPLNTNNYVSQSGASSTTISDTNYKLACSTSAYNLSTAQTLTYEMPAGEHYIYIKYTKDSGTSSNNDSLQFKVLSIEPLEPVTYYTYNLSNIQADHSLIFIFGDVTYYFVNSSGTNCKLFPSGSFVQLPGDTYSLTIVPDDYSYEVTVIDNNTNVTSSVQRVEREVTKNGETYTVVNYTYQLSNIQATHNISVTCSPVTASYIKVNDGWVKINHLYKKISGVWVEQTRDFTEVLSSASNMIFYGGEMQPPHDYTQDYLTLTARETCVFTFNLSCVVNNMGSTRGSISYSTNNGASWTTTTASTTDDIKVNTPEIAPGGKVLWKGNITNGARNSSGGAMYDSLFYSTGLCDVSGRLSSLSYGDSFSNNTCPGTKSLPAFPSLFSKTTSSRDPKIVDASNLILFNNTTPTCYKYMFQNCTTLVNGPKLLATTLTESCYALMFYGCTSLQSITMLATDTSATSCLANWVTNVPSGGTFTKAASMTSLPTGTSGIPSGWTVIDY